VRKVCAGVEHFFLYNHQSSTEDHVGILQPYIDSGLVTLDQAICDGHCQVRKQQRAQRDGCCQISTVRCSECCNALVMHCTTPLVPYVAMHCTTPLMLQCTALHRWCRLVGLPTAWPEKHGCYKTWLLQNMVATKHVAFRTQTFMIPIRNLSNEKQGVAARDEPHISPRSRRMKSASTSTDDQPDGSPS
jgi:hypothetical protein